jgi:pilus assembly protein CpaE
MPEISSVPGSGAGANGAGDLSIALIGPDEPRRKAVADALADCQQGVVQEFNAYPNSPDELPLMLEEQHDVVLVDADSDPQLALAIVKSISDEGSRIAMAYSAQTNLELAIRFMRVGAREILSLPLAAADMADALARISILAPRARPARRTTGSLFVFLGAKGGCGVTTIASNFAISLAQVSGQKTLLIDFGLPLGDAALNLGIIAKFSTDNAFYNSSRLDTSFLSSLLTMHSSGLSVLAAPGELRGTEVPAEAINKLLAVARENFDYVVVDAGSRLDLMDSALFDAFATVYLITQVGVSELRNSNRMITRYFASRDSKLQIVINRYTPQTLLFGEEHITKALTRPAQWRIPDDYATARRTQNTANPIALQDSPISKAIREMARKACGVVEKQEKKRGFSLFGKAR